MDILKRLSDEEVVEITRTKSPDSYAVIMARYQEKLLRYAFSISRDEHAAADVVQESFIKAFLNLNSFNVKKKFSSWIYRIVHNEAMNAIKKYRKEVAIPDKIDLKDEAGPEQDYSRQETVVRIERCLEKMPLIYGEPLRLYYIDEISYEEIGEILRLPIGTVATRISRAKLLMKRLCQQN